MELADYKAMYDKALTELARLMEQREQLEIECDNVDIRITQVRQGIDALVPLCDENPYMTHPDLFPIGPHTFMPNTGLTDAIRKVMANIAPMSATAVSVRTGLKTIGYEIDSKNILPSIHTILKRLEEKGEVVSKEVKGKTWYRWKAPKHRANTKPKWAQMIDWAMVTEEMKAKKKS